MKRERESGWKRDLDERLTTTEIKKLKEDKERRAHTDLRRGIAKYLLHLYIYLICNITQYTLSKAELFLEGTPFNYYSHNCPPDKRASL